MEKTKTNKPLLSKTLKSLVLLVAFLFSSLSGTLIQPPAASAATYGPLGPDISVGIYAYSKSDLEKNPFKMDANKDFVIKDDDGKKLGTVLDDYEVSVKYAGDGNLKLTWKVSSSSTKTATVSKKVYFEAADGNNTDLIFETSKPDGYDKFRGTIKIRYSDTSKKIWIINVLPLEQYVWGVGEIRGTGDSDYNKTMTTMFRTYAYWKKKYSTKYASEGFKIDATPGNQLYYGYNWEKDHLNIRKAAEKTRGKIIKYDGDVALNPYSSWTDGKTRRYEDGHWGSTCDTNIGGTKSKTYPWLDSVSDSYGKRSGYKTCDLAKAGNHMVGLSAHGALELAGDHGWAWDKILKYYFDDVSLSLLY